MRVNCVPLFRSTKSLAHLELIIVDNGAVLTLDKGILHAEHIRLWNPLAGKGVITFDCDG